MENQNNHVLSIFMPDDPLHLTKYNILKKIGKGTFSTVYLCEDEHKNQYAMKAHYDNGSIVDKKRAIILNDANVITRIQSHPNVIQVKEVIQKGTITMHDEEPQKVFAIMILESLRGGELYYQIKKCEKFSIATSRYYFLQLASALQHLHNKGYCHRDLKPWNIMVSDDFTQLKVIDFGYATPLEKAELDNSSVYFKNKLSCTKNYMAPELYERVITYPLDRSDVFALGVILINFLTGKYPFDKTTTTDNKLDDKYVSFQQDPSAFILSSCDYDTDLQNQELADLIVLIKAMLHPQKDERISIDDVLSHEWVVKYDVGTSLSVRQELIEKNTINKHNYHYLQSPTKKEPSTSQELEERKSSLNKGMIPDYNFFTDNTTVVMTDITQIGTIIDILEEFSKSLLGKITRKEDSIYQFFIEASTEVLKINSPLLVNFEFYEIQEGQICFELSRTKGDYLSFMDLFMLVQNKFN